jgi:ABC-type multidrug transport system fused ATPase/permease subunit
MNGKYKDDDRKIWEALEMVEMKDVVLSLGSGGLDEKVVEGMK